MQRRHHPKFASASQFAFTLALSILSAFCSASSPSAPSSTPTRPSTTSLSGKVSNGLDGSPVPNVAVEVISPEADKGVRTTTGADGAYRLTGIKSTTFTVSFTHPSYRAFAFEYTFALGTERTDLTTALTPVTKIGGRVSEAQNGPPVSNVEVEITKPEADRGIRTTTDASGNYQLSGITSATFTISFTHPLFQPVSVEYTYRPGSEYTLPLTVLTAPPISIRIDSISPVSDTTLPYSFGTAAPPVQVRVSWTYRDSSARVGIAACLADDNRSSIILASCRAFAVATSGSGTLNPSMRSDTGRQITRTTRIVAFITPDGLGVGLYKPEAEIRMLTRTESPWVFNWR